MTGIVYCLTNPEMPDLVKIGMTADLEGRLRTLDNTSVPVPFECVMAVEVDDPGTAERLLHEVFDERRVRKSREFFRVGAQHVVAAMRLTGGRDVTPGSDVVEDEESRRALEQSRARRGRFNFNMVGIPVGAEVYFRPDPGQEEPITAMVHSHNSILFEGEVVTLSRAAGDILERRGMARTVAGPEYWYFEDESLGDRRRRMEDEGGE